LDPTHPGCRIVFIRAWVEKHRVRIRHDGTDIRTYHIYTPGLELVTTEEGEGLTERRIAVIGVVSYGVADPGGRCRAPGDTRELP